MWDDVASRDEDLKAMKSISAKHAKMFFALGAVCYYMVQRQRMLGASLDEAPQILQDMKDEATKMLLEAKENFKSHSITPTSEG